MVPYDGEETQEWTTFFSIEKLRGIHLTIQKRGACSHMSSPQ